MSEWIIDIETRPDPKLKKIAEGMLKPKKGLKDPSKIKADIEEKKLKLRKKMATDPDYAKVVCIGIKEVGGPGKLYKLKDMEQWFKDNVVSEGRAGHREWKTCTIITFNGRNFDLPLLIKAGLKNNLDFPYKILNNYCIKRKSNYFAAGDYENDASRIRHIDLIEVVSGSFKQDERKSLDAYSQIFSGEKKNTKGDEFFATATDKQLEEHCLEDLPMTENLYKIFKKII